MDCLHCGKRLTLLRKLTDSEFCTDAHRRSYQQEQEQMALARLSDAGKGKKKKKAEAEKPVPEPKDEPGFVDWNLRGTEWVGRREVETEPIAAQPVSYLPEKHVQFEARPAAAEEMALSEPRVRAAASGSGPEEPVPEPVHMDILRPAAIHGAALQTSLSSVSAREPMQEPAARTAQTTQCPPFGPMEKEQPAVLPVFGDNRLISMPVARDVVVQLTSLEVAMTTHSAPALEGFGNKPLLTAMGNQLHILEGSVTERHEGANDATIDLPSVLIALSRPAPRPGKRAARKVRPRELFFPLPRLGDLSSTASRLGGKNISVTRQSGTGGAPWKPGQVRIEFPLSAVDHRMGHGVQAFDAAQPESAQPRHLPTFATERPTIGQFGMGPRLDDISLFLAGDAAKDAAIRIAGEVEAVSMEMRQAEPSLSIRLPEALVRHTSELNPLSPRAIWADAHARPVAYESIIPKVESTLLPQTGNRMAGHRLGMDSCTAMTPLEAPAASPSKQPCRGEDLQFQPGKPAVQATFPGSVLRREYVPAFAGKVVPVASGNGVPYPVFTVAIQDLAPLWPEPDCLAPQSRSSVIEDSAMREAVKAMSALLLEEDRSFFARLRMPSLSRPDLKWFVMSVPAILLLSLYLLTNKDSQPGLPELPQVSEVTLPDPQPEPAVEPEPVVSEPKPAAQKQAAVVEKPAQSAVTVPVANSTSKPEEGFLGGIRQSITQRAAVNLSDDFRSGLGDWEGEGDWSKQWAYDAAGFLHTGSLILYKPSLSLTDYRMEFLGRIEKKSMGWVYRAVDRKNYYAHKITLTKSGPMPTAVVERYAVINGKTVSLARRPLPMQVQLDSSYRIRMDVRGNGYTLTVQGQIVDHWSDDRLKSGGIGFFSARGEQASLRWVELSHQYDFLGRLCAFLAPYSLPAKEGSLKQ